MNIILSNQVVCSSIPSNLEHLIKARLTFPNPKYVENDRLGYWNGDTPQEIMAYTKRGDSLFLPRGWIRQLLSLCNQNGIKYQLQDQRRSLVEIDFQFRGTLKPFQEEAVKAVLARDFGTLSAPPGSGKTVKALYLIAERKQPALIVTHTKELQNQWVARTGSFLGIPPEEIGIIGNGERTIGKKITVALVQSVYKHAEEVVPHIGFVIVDEAHHCPSRTFTEAITAFDSKYMLGLSATPWRRDGLSRLIFWYVGDLCHEVKKEALQDSGDILRAQVILRETNFQTSFDPSEEYSRMLSELTEDPLRNSLIVDDVVKEASNGGGICLVLSDRKAHCEELRRLLALKGISSELLTGDLPNNRRQAVIAQLNRGRVKVLVATSSLIGEGFDCRELSTLFLTTPIKFNGRVLQYLGRVLRPAPGKTKALVHDYIDVKVPVLRASAKARERVYANC